ncbi:MAG: hypothetical protein KA184_16395 [Candidatus Hydrogenedentes bacterium]|nr:hypothetical protein [Candidatus Hydrogenedentota bacterium]
MQKRILWSRRRFLGACAASGAVTAAAGRTRAAAAERNHLDRFEHYEDEQTGARVYRLTPGPQRDDIIYQTHPMWTPNRDILVFKSDRTSGNMAPHGLDMRTGEVHPLLPEAKGGDFTLTHRGADVFWLDGRDVFTAQVQALLTGNAEPRRIAALPGAAQSTLGMLSVDANEAALYTGALFEADKKWGIIGLDLKTGAWDILCETGFQVGHVQANPERSGLVLFCHETGGFAEQRTWLLDVSKRTYRPFYVSTSREWVTHEVWWGGGQVLFTVWPYDDEHRNQAHGVFLADLDGKAATVVQYAAWHTHGSPDKRWIMGDDFDRNIWLAAAGTHEKRLLTQGHKGRDFETHPHGSFTPDSRGMVFNSSKFGTEDILLVQLPRHSAQDSAMRRHFWRMSRARVKQAR